MARALFLDRDGTLIQDQGHLRYPSQVKFYPGVFQALRPIWQKFLLFIVTHQSGVGKGLLQMEDVQRVNDYVRMRFADAGVPLRAIYTCPHRRQENCRCAKPRPFFLRQAQRDYDVDLSASYVIGDHPHDVEMAAKVRARGIYVLTGHGRHHRNELRRTYRIARDLVSALRWISQERNP